ncbi:MAG: hypothetical protein KGI41_03700 [Patescibacteria group bacterium]|nr:hypothetical protein [Patescibacteria group bacterium]MDE1966316.1 hypothetical protein [Patescibacteria group bacterium]
MERMPKTAPAAEQEHVELAAEDIQDPEIRKAVQDVLEEAAADARAFRDYMDAPDLYVKREQEAKAAAAEEGRFIGESAEELRMLYNAGVRPDDLVAFGQREAARTKSRLEMKASIPKTSMLKLRLTQAGFELIARITGRNVDIMLPKAERVVDPLVPDPMQGIAVKPLLYDINPTGSQDVSLYNQNFQNMLEAHEMLAAIKAEFTRRSAEPKAV